MKFAFNVTCLGFLDSEWITDNVFPVIVILLSAMFILWLWTELEGKHNWYHYDYDRKNKISRAEFYYKYMVSFFYKI